MGLEILEDCPDVRTVICRDRRRRADHRRRQRDQGDAARREGPRRGAGDRRALCACRCAKAARASFADWQAIFVDGAGGQSVTERMWQRMQPVVDGAITVTLDQMREAMRLMAEKARVIAEGAGALALAAALTGEAGEGPIVCVVSGGNIDLKQIRRARRRLISGR